MNKQFKIIDGERIATGIEWCDYAGHNPIAGCQHACRWRIDGELVKCYADTAAGGLAQKFYPHGFNHHYWHPERLDNPLKVKRPSAIFPCSMADMFGHWVPEWQINAVLDSFRRAHWHTFMLLTKNAKRAAKFDMPPNAWLGASSPPDWMNGKRLTLEQKKNMLRVSLIALGRSNATVKFMSFEPLSWNCAVMGELTAALDWAIVGGASKGRVKLPPYEANLWYLMDELDYYEVPTFFKDNMPQIYKKHYTWRREWPGGKSPLAFDNA